MSTITKEWLQQAINDYESVRDELPFGLDDYQGKILAALHIALASLEAEPVAQVLSSRAGNDTSTIDKALPEGTMLYTAPPAPVSVPDDVMAAMQKVARIRLDLNDFDGDKRGILDCLSDAEEALIEVVNRRAAMLQGADGTLTNEVTIPAYTPCKDAPEHIWLQTAGVWPENGEFSELTWCCDNQHPADTLYVRADVVTGNSPLIPDWQAEAEKMAELHGSSFVVFRNGEFPQCADPTKVIIYFTDEGLGHGSAAPQQEVNNG